MWPQQIYLLIYIFMYLCLMSGQSVGLFGCLTAHLGLLPIFDINMHACMRFRMLSKPNWTESNWTEPHIHYINNLVACVKWIYVTPFFGCKRPSYVQSVYLFNCKLFYVAFSSCVWFARFYLETVFLGWFHNQMIRSWMCIARALELHKNGFGLDVHF